MHRFRDMSYKEIAETLGVSPKTIDYRIQQALKQPVSYTHLAIQKAVAKYTCNCEQTVVTDIHLQPDQTSGQLNIYNDEDVYKRQHLPTATTPSA